MIDLVLDIATWVLMLAGSGLLLMTGIGLLRFPDLYTRMHAGGMADTLATVCIFVGLALQSGFSLVTAKLLIIVVFIFFTSPTAAYALAQASYVDGLKPELDGFGDDDTANRNTDA